jgi:transposase
MDKDVLQGFLEEGLSIEEIGRRFGRHPSTVSYWLRKHRLRAAHRERHSAKGGIERELLAALVAAGLPQRAIAMELGISQATVRHWLGRYGMQTTRRPRRLSALSDRQSETGLAVFSGFCEQHGPSDFVPRSDGGYRCVRCRSDAVTRRRQKVKATLVQEAGGACALCGYDRAISALAFHHVDPARKTFSVSAGGLGRSLSTARNEAEKCVLLCSNCHAEVEAGVAQLG